MEICGGSEQIPQFRHDKLGGTAGEEIINGLAQAREERLEASLVAPPMWGAVRTFSIFSRGLSGSRGSFSSTSSPAPAIWPAWRARIRAGSSTWDSGGVDEVGRMFHHLKFSVADAVGWYPGGGHVQGDIIALPENSSRSETS